MSDVIQEAEMILTGRQLPQDDSSTPKIKLYSPADLIAAYEQIGSQESFKLLGHEGYIFRGWTTLLSGYAKAGKTTLLSQFLRDIAPVKALYIAEEPPAIWGERIKDNAAAYEHVSFAPALNAPVEEIVNLVKTTEAAVIIIDTLRNLLAIRDENDNSVVVQRLVPLIGAAQKDSKTLILCHHTRKGGGQYSEGAAGAGAFMGLVDVGLEIRRDSYDSESPRREIHGWGRLHLIEPLSYQLTSDGTLEALGSPQSVRKEAVKAQVLDTIGEDKTTVKELWDSMGEGRPSKEQVRRACVELAEEGQIIKDNSERTHYFFKPTEDHQQRPYPKVVGDDGQTPTQSPTASNGETSLEMGNTQLPNIHQQPKENSVVGDVKKSQPAEIIANESPTPQPAEKANPNLLDDVQAVFGDAALRIEDIPL